MEDFETFVSKHGEVMVFYLMDKWEQYRGGTQDVLSIEDRWARFIAETNDNHAPLTQIVSA